MYARARARHGRAACTHMVIDPVPTLFLGPRDQGAEQMAETMTEVAVSVDSSCSMEISKANPTLPPPPGVAAIKPE